MTDVAHDHEDFFVVGLLRQLINFLRLQELVDRVCLANMLVVDVVEVGQLEQLGEVEVFARLHILLLVGRGDHDEDFRGEELAIQVNHLQLLCESNYYNKLSYKR